MQIVEPHNNHNKIIKIEKCMATQQCKNLLDVKDYYHDAICKFNSLKKEIKNKYNQLRQEIFAEESNKI